MCCFLLLSFELSLSLSLSLSVVTLTRMLTASVEELEITAAQASGRTDSLRSTHAREIDRLRTDIAAAEHRVCHCGLFVCGVPPNLSFRTDSKHVTAHTHTHTHTHTHSHTHMRIYKLTRAHSHTHMDMYIFVCSLSPSLQSRAALPLTCQLAEERSAADAARHAFKAAEDRVAVLVCLLHLNAVLWFLFV
jgi:hypothetical protein